MSLVYPLPVPQGQSPPLAVVTDTDHRAWIYIAAALGFCMTLLSTAIRVFIKCNAKTGWTQDDLVLGASTAVGFIQTAIILAAGSYGFGTSVHELSDKHRDSAEKLFYISNLFYVLAVGISRLSLVLFVRQLTKVRSHIQALNGFACVLTAWTAGLFLAIVLQCNLSHPWSLRPQCAQGWYARWEAGEIIGAVLELILFGMAFWFFVWNVQTTRQRKLKTVTIFSLRLLVLIPIGFRLASFSRVGFLRDSTLSLATFACWTQSEMNFSIIAVTVPMTRVLLSTLATGYGSVGGPNALDCEYASNTSSRVKRSQQCSQSGEEVQLDTISRAPPTKFWRHDSAAEVQVDGGRGTYSYGISSKGGGHHSRPGKGGTEGENGATGEAYAGSVGSNSSQKMFIRRDVSYDVAYDR